MKISKTRFMCRSCSRRQCGRAAEDTELGGDTIALGSSQLTTGDGARMPGTWTSNGLTALSACRHQTPRHKDGMPTLLNDHHGQRRIHKPVRWVPGARLFVRTLALSFPAMLFVCREVSEPRVPNTGYSPPAAHHKP